MAIAARTSARAAAREMRSRAIPQTLGAPSPMVVWALARVEAWRMLRHPAFVVALGLGVLVFGGLRGSEFQVELLVFGLGLALVVGTLFAANLGALRSRRDGTDELFGSASASLATRTAGLLSAVIVGPVVVSCVWVIGVVVLDRTGVVEILDDTRPIVLLQAPLVVAAIGSLGVMTARLIPHPVGGAIVFALHTVTPLVWALPWVVIEQDATTYAWHFAYLAGAAVTFSSAAFLRDRIRPVPAATFAAGLLVSVLAAVQRVPDGGW